MGPGDDALNGEQRGGRVADLDQTGNIDRLANAPITGGTSGSTRTVGNVGGGGAGVSSDVSAARMSPPTVTEQPLARAPTTPTPAGTGDRNTTSAAATATPAAADAPAGSSTTTTPATTASTSSGAAPPQQPAPGGQANPDRSRPNESARGGLPADLASLWAGAQRAHASGDLVGARELANRLLLDPRTSEGDKSAVRAFISEINSSLLFSPRIDQNDPMTLAYTVQSGDSLSRIAARQNTATDWRFIQRINKMSNPNALRAGQTLKLVRGPFHAVVNKGAYRLDLYWGPSASPPPSELAGPAIARRNGGVEPNWVYITSFPVGLGEFGLTPEGSFVVRGGSKLVNPAWVNPRTGERFAPDDPKNPIGEHWLGIRGVDDATIAVSGYGLHGTIEPESIGRDMSMGCVRMHDEAIATVWEMLVDEISTVRIVP